MIGKIIKKGRVLKCSVTTNSMQTAMNILEGRSGENIECRNKMEKRFEELNT